MNTKLILLSIFLVFSGTISFSQTRNISDVPAWAKQAIWYQIFPERFYNSDKSNDPKPVDMEGAWPYYIPEGWQIHPWTSDWYKLQPWEVKTGHDFYWNAGVRRYGGDLQGVIDKLDYLKDLGITAIYLNPIFESPSLHKYDAAMYHHIDNNFGPDAEGDRKIWGEENPADPASWKWTAADKLFLKLISEVHKRGMKIIIDGVFNHTGTQFWAFKDIVKNQQKSEYKDWYTIKSWEDPAKGTKFDYAGWIGVKDLPELREDENGLVSGPREHIHAIVKRWMDPDGDGNPSDGIDGWRLDVAEQVNHNFWKTFRTWVKGINPEAYIVGEIWWDDWQNYKMMNASPWLKGDEFDAVMNYRFARAMKNFIINRKEPIGPGGFVDSLNTLYREYPEKNNYVMMDLLDSHDVERVASMIVNPDIWYDHNGNPGSNKDFDVRKPNETERLKQKLLVALQFSLPGAPMIYYGDEAGMWGGDDPDCRKPMVWPEFKYDTETTHPFGKPRPADEVKFDEELFKYHKKIAAIRNENKALALGNISFVLTDDQNGVLGFTREFEGDKIFVLLNNNNKVRNVSSAKLRELLNTERLKDMVSGGKISLQHPGEQVKLNPYQILICKIK